MKKITYHLIFLLVILSVNLPKVQAQANNVAAQNKNIQQFIQVWGLVKYKSPTSIAGNFDADQVFLALIDQVKMANGEQFNQLLATMLNKAEVPLTSNDPSYDRKKLNTYQHLVKNVDYSWIEAKEYSVSVKKQLTGLSNQLNLTGKHHYIPAVWYEGDLPNEAPYATYAFNQESMNLLALAKAWNAVEYLSPYKYMTDKNWTRVLTAMVPTFRAINNRESYEKSILLLAVAINDTHSGEMMQGTNLKTIPAIFKVRYYPPFDYKAEAKEIIVKKFLNDSLAQQSEIKIGDQLIAINGIKVEQWLKERMQFIPASNLAVKYRELSTTANNRGDTFAFTGLQSDTLKVKVLRGKTILNLKLVLLDRQNKQHIKLIENDIIQKRTMQRSIKGKENIGNDITLFRAGHFFDKDLPKSNELEQLSAELKSKKAIIFDMRQYPEGPGLFSYYIPLLLGKGPFIFARYYAADLKDPGTFIHREGVENYMHVAKDGPKAMGELYGGKIVILTNEDTQSMGEWFSMMLRQMNNNATIIGSQTAGADGDLRKLTLPGAYRFTFTGNGIFYPDGRETQRIGIQPDIYFKPSAKDLISTGDAQLQRAIKFIKEGK